MLLWLLSLVCSFNVLLCANPRATFVPYRNEPNPRSSSKRDASSSSSFFSAESVLQEFQQLPTEHVLPEEFHHIPREHIFPVEPRNLPTKRLFSEEFSYIPTEHVLPANDSPAQPVPVHTPEKYTNVPSAQVFQEELNHIPGEQDYPEHDATTQTVQVTQATEDNDNALVGHHLKPLSSLPKRLLGKALNAIRAQWNLPTSLGRRLGADETYNTAVDVFEQLLRLASEANISTTVHGVEINQHTIGAARTRIQEYRQETVSFTSAQSDARVLRIIMCGDNGQSVGAPESLRDVTTVLSAYALTLYPEMTLIRFDEAGDVLVDGTRFPTSEIVRQYRRELPNRSARATVIKQNNGSMIFTWTLPKVPKREKPMEQNNGNTTHTRAAHENDKDVENPKKKRRYR